MVIVLEAKMTQEGRREFSLSKLSRIIQSDDGFLEDQLVIASLYILLFEYLRNMVRERLEVLYSNQWEMDEDGKIKNIVDQKYGHLFVRKSKKDKHPFEKQLDHFREMEALSDDDIQLIHFFRERRDKIAHALLEVVADDKTTHLEVFEVETLVGMIYKLDNWWFREFEVSIQPELRDEFDEDALEKGHTLATQLLIHFVDKVRSKISSSGMKRKE